MLKRFPYVVDVVDNKAVYAYRDDKYIIDRDRCLTCIINTGILGKAPRLYPLEDHIQR